MPKPQRSAPLVAPSKHSSHSDAKDPGVRVIKIPRNELARDPFRYVSAPPTMKGDKAGDSDSDE